MPSLVATWSIQRVTSVPLDNDVRIPARFLHGAKQHPKHRNPPLSGFFVAHESIPDPATERGLSFLEAP